MREVLPEEVERPLLESDVVMAHSLLPSGSTERPVGGQDAEDAAEEVAQDASSDAPFAGARSIPAYPGFLGALRRVCRGIGGWIFGSFLSIRVENAPDFSRIGPVVLAPNHTSYLDPPILQCACRVHLTFVMTDAIYSIPVFRWFFALWGAIPVSERKVSAGAIKRALMAIRSGRPVAIFPEGRISEDGFLQEGRGGVVMLVVKGAVPVIPVAILGTYDALPKRASWPRRARIVVRFGEAIPPPTDGGRDAIAAFAERVMGAIADLGAPRRPEGTAVASAFESASAPSPA